MPMMSILSATLLTLLAAAPQTPKRTPARPPSSVEIQVTDQRSGAALRGARVSIDGEPELAGDTNVSGRVTFRGMKAGTYTVRVERDAFVALEKEFTVAAGDQAWVVAALSPQGAPLTRATTDHRPAAASPSPARTSLLSAGVVGEPRVLFIPDFAEAQLQKGDSLKESPLGCSGTIQARLLQVRDPLALHAHGDADETLYVVAGEGTLTIGDAEQRISPGWFSIVPRGMAHSLSRKGRNPIIVLSLVSGQPCARTTVVAAGR